MAAAGTAGGVENLSRGSAVMTQLRLADGFGGRGDEFYERLIATHQGLSDADSRAVNARLVVLLANHIGDLEVIAQACAAARASLTAAGLPGS
jgi:hypothetical protein